MSKVTIGEWKAITRDLLAKDGDFRMMLWKNLNTVLPCSVSVEEVDFVEKRNDAVTKVYKCGDDIDNLPDKESRTTVNIKELNVKVQIILKGKISPNFEEPMEEYALLCADTLDEFDEEVRFGFLDALGHKFDYLPVTCKRTKGNEWTIGTFGANVLEYMLTASDEGDDQ